MFKEGKREVEKKGGEVKLANEKKCFSLLLQKSKMGQFWVKS